MDPALLKRTNRLLHLFQKHESYAGTYARPLYELLTLTGINPEKQSLIFTTEVTDF